jgi:hypothetical protein
VSRHHRAEDLWKLGLASREMVPVHSQVVASVNFVMLTSSFTSKIWQKKLEHNPSRKFDYSI